MSFKASFVLLLSVFLTVGSADEMLQHGEQEPNCSSPTVLPTPKHGTNSVSEEHEDKENQGNQSEKLKNCTAYKRPEVQVPPECCVPNAECGRTHPAIVSWYFDIEYGFCTMYRFGGECEPTTNHFPNCTACEMACSRRTAEEAEDFC
uniref:Putative secreted protein n=1 Tax=Amblyomma cajennense TaxID=34607 RepID=A0A023FE49_AMBCJ